MDNKFFKKLNIYKKLKNSSNFNLKKQLNFARKVFDYSVKKTSDFLSTNSYLQKNKQLVKEKSTRFVRWFNEEFTPKSQNYADLIIKKLTFGDGDDNWNSIKPSNKWSRITIWTLVYFAGFGIVWASFAKVDETVQSTGKLEPIGTTIDVKVPLGGVIEKILVKEGQVVKEKQVLLKLDTTAVVSKLKALKMVKSQIEADILLSRIQLGEEVPSEGLSENQKFRLDSLKKEYQSRIDSSKNAIKKSEVGLKSAEENVESINKVLRVREEILNNLKPLKEVGGISQVKFLKEEVEVIQLRGKLETAKADLDRAEENLLESLNRLENTIAASQIDFSTKIEENTKQLAQLENQISESRLTLSYQEIKSPVDGYVFDLQPAAPGYVVNSNLPILKIVPADDLVARVFISNKDIAFIKKGQTVKIRVDAYPYNEFGEISGKIESIGSDVLEPDEKYNFFRFPVTIQLDQPYILSKKRKLPLMSGMSLSVNIVLRSRPVISIFTEQVLPFWDKLEQL